MLKRALTAFGLSRLPRLLRSKRARSLFLNLCTPTRHRRDTDFAPPLTETAPTSRDFFAKVGTETEKKLFRKENFPLDKGAGKMVQ